LIKKYTIVSAFLSILLVLVALPQAQSEVFRAPIEELDVASSALEEWPAVPGLECDQGESAVKYRSLIAQFDQAFPEFWLSAGRPDELVNQIKNLHFDGLSPGDYLSFSDSLSIPLPACSRLQLTLAMFSALSDLMYGKVDPEKAGLLWRYQMFSENERQQALWGLLESSGGDLAAVFAAARPKLPEYLDLRKAYQDSLDQTVDYWPQVAAGETLRQGDRSSRVAQLRQRLLAESLLVTDSVRGQDDLFDVSLDNAVRLFQGYRGLRIDGIVGKNTLRELNRSQQSLADIIRLNLERMRWYAKDLSGDGVLVDITEQRLVLKNQGVIAWRTRVQVGSSGRQTPALASYFSHLTINPTWTVPPTILRKDKLPEIRQDLDYLARHRIRVFDQLGTELDPSAIDWSRPGPVILRQDAGPDSALGLVAFRFPNPFSVYLHDTPSKRLFDAEERFFSSGCVRVEGAMTLAEKLVTRDTQSGISRLRELLQSSKTRNLTLAEPVPLLMVYLTARADDRGNLTFRPDFYNRDERLLGLLNK